MAHISAPRPGGALAALDSAPDADVVFMAHYGFPDGFGAAVARAAGHDADPGPDVARAGRGDPGRHGRPHRLAVRLVADARRLGGG